MNRQYKRELPEYMKLRPYAKYYYNPFPVPESLYAEIGDNTPTEPEKLITIDQMNRLITDDSLEVRRGWSLLDDGTATCMGYMDFPGAQPDMFHWWFCWMPLDPLRGKIWEPVHHEEILATQDQLRKLTDYSIPVRERVWGVHFFPVDLGVRADPNAEIAPNRVEFVSPVEFGFDPDAVAKIQDNTDFICAQTGPIGAPAVTSFCHVFKPIEGGMRLISTFWYGYKIVDRQPVKASVQLPEQARINLCKSQSIHLIDEYYQLSRILPELYHTYKDIPENPWDFV